VQARRLDRARVAKPAMTVREDQLAVGIGEVCRPELAEVGRECSDLVESVVEAR
jgi:hypothetical protein